MKYIIVSDLHLGTKHSKAKEFLKFIDENPCDELILNGDIVDGWALQRGTKWRPSHTKVISKLIKEFPKFIAAFDKRSVLAKVN